MMLGQMHVCTAQTFSCKLRLFYTSDMILSDRRESRSYRLRSSLLSKNRTRHQVQQVQKPLSGKGCNLAHYFTFMSDVCIAKNETNS